MTAADLAQALGCALPLAENWGPSLTTAMDLYGIDTPVRQAAFIAQIGHESGRLQFVLELWGPTPDQRGYEGRADLGNTQLGDGFRYRGRGLIQITGRANYSACRDGLRLVADDTPDFEVSPELLEAPRWAALSAAWYWASHGCNELADAGAFMSVTRAINGGTNGYADRLALWQQASEVLA